MIITCSLMLLSGAALGFLYFSGLYWTLRKSSNKDNKIWWLTLSFLVRVSILASILYVLADGDWKRLILLAAGFSASRFIWVLKIKRGTNP
ncbi:MAG: ATP synthase subunit I [Thermodesulfobacteriota bacterium]